MYELIEHLDELANKMGSLIPIIQKIEADLDVVDVDDITSDGWEIPDIISQIEMNAEDIVDVTNMAQRYWKKKIYPRLNP